MDMGKSQSKSSKYDIIIQERNDTTSGIILLYQNLKIEIICVNTFNIKRIIIYGEHPHYYLNIKCDSYIYYPHLATHFIRSINTYSHIHYTNLYCYCIKKDNDEYNKLIKKENIIIDMEF